MSEIHTTNNSRCSTKASEQYLRYFLESFNLEKFEENIYPIKFVQDNESKSTSKGVLRGLHFQLPPFTQNKLVRVIKGEVLDVAVDIRRKSPTFGRHVAVELSENNNKQLFVPGGFAHGFIVLSKEAIFSYKVDAYYSAEHEEGIAYNDKARGVNLIKQVLNMYLKEMETTLIYPTIKNYFDI